MACSFCGNSSCGRGRTFVTGSATVGGTRNQCGNRRPRCVANTNAMAAAVTSESIRRSGCAQRAVQRNNCCCKRCTQQRANCSGDRIGRELYGAAAAKNTVYTTCSDPCGGSREYRLDQRNTYWPTFARPRWLTCDELYGRHNRRR